MGSPKADKSAYFTVIKYFWFIIWHNLYLVMKIDSLQHWKAEKDKKKDVLRRIT